MKGLGLHLTIGERVAFYRRRRGLTQVALAGLVGRTESWIEKIENGRALLDRLSVIHALAEALDVSVHDLLPDDVADTGQARGQSVPALRNLVLSYRSVNPRFAADADGVEIPELADLHRLVDDVWAAYQDSRFAYAVMQLNQALPAAYVASRESTMEADGSRALAYLYQAAASVLVKLGDLDLARLCADRGDIAALTAGDLVTRLSLQRSIAHTLLSNGQFEDAVTVVRDGIVDAGQPVTPEELSVAGTLMLVGAMASARAGERREAETFLRHAAALAEELARDGNEVWTSFGPTNVMIHRVAVAAELGDMATAVDLGIDVNASMLPRERRIRHELEMARAFTYVGRRGEAVQAVLAAERIAPEQVRRHFLTHELVHAWVRSTVRRPEAELVALAARLGHAS